MNSHPKEVKRKQYVESQKCTSQNEESVMSSSGAGDDRPKKTCPFYKRVPGIALNKGQFSSLGPEVECRDPPRTIPSDGFFKSHFYCAIFSPGICP